MIKLKELLKESVSWKAWWMDPNAKLYEVYKDDPQQGHFNWAKDYLRKSGANWDINHDESPSTILLNKGWVRVTFNYYRDNVLHFDYAKGKLPNQKQVKELKDMAIEMESELFNDTDNVEVNLLEESILNEYVSNPIIYLKKYLSMSAREQKEDFIGHNSYLVREWIKKHKSHDKNLVSLLENDDDFEIIELLRQKLPEDYTDFLDWSYSELDNRKNVDSEFVPSWYVMHYKEDVRDQWLIHFSDHADDIWSDQKFLGTDDLYQLGYTHGRQNEKTHDGYNFAYALGDYLKYARSNFRSRGWKYGKEAVIFKSSGIKVYHYGDEEPQVIFWGPASHDIVYIRELDGDWGVVNSKSSRVIYRNEFPDVVKWIVNNFNQYKSVLLP